MEAKHTPGPWECPGNNDHETMLEMDDYHRVRIKDAHGSSLAVVSARKSGPRETAQNARLMAAAPDLFEALEECRRILSHNFQDDDREILRGLEKANTAIAKAEGRE